MPKKQLTFDLSLVAKGLRNSGKEQTVIVDMCRLITDPPMNPRFTKHYGDWKEGIHGEWCLSGWSSHRCDQRIITGILYLPKTTSTPVYPINLHTEKTMVNTTVEVTHQMFEDLPTLVGLALRLTPTLAEKLQTLSNPKEVK